MKLSRLGEFGLIEKVRRRARAGKGVRIGIGDDAAWVAAKDGSLLVASDLLLEGVHFDLRWTTFRDLGHKALAVNLSDIAAMGGIPAYAVVSLGAPADFDSRQILEFYDGFGSLAAKHAVALVGGDTSAAKTLLISVCVIGHCPYRPVTRAGARPGNDIYVSGTLGDSALGLRLLKEKSARIHDPAELFLVGRHRRPTPRVELGAQLAKAGLALAMIDVSDGLLQDLSHLCKASRVGALIWQEEVPLSAAYRRVAGNGELADALSGGEDYELLFCARASDRSRIARLGERLKVPVRRIGRCVGAAEHIHVLGRDGKPVTVDMAGHDHFRPAGGR